MATVSFGQNERQNVSRVAYFWILPLKPILIIFLSLVLVVLIILWIIKIYISRSLAVVERRLKIITTTKLSNRTRRK